MKTRKPVPFYADVTNRNTMLREDYKTYARYKPMARFVKTKSKWVSNTFWAAVNVFGLLGCFYQITEMGGHLPKLFM